MKPLAATAILTVTILIVLAHLAATDPKPLTMKLSSHVGFAPCDLRIQLHLEPDPSDRELHVLADSGGFYRRSDWTIEGEHAARLYTVEWRALGPGEYDVVAQVGNPSGARATARDRIRVISP